MIHMIFHDPCGDRVAQGPAFLEQEDRIMELSWRVLNKKTEQWNSDGVS